MRLLFTILSLIASFQTDARDIEISHLSGTRTIARVNGDKKYLLLPIEDAAPEAAVKVLADAVLKCSFNARLAVRQVDYLVPVDLESLRGKEILLDITLPKTESGAPGGDILWTRLKTSDEFDTTNREAFRPAYHFSPAYGWMNDPNGMVRHNGLWHLFFQYNPYGSVWGNMTWGHAVSKDLVHWDQWENAIFPDALGTIYSGSAVVDDDNSSGFGKDVIVAMYTSAGATQTQSIAWSDDGGRTFKKYAGNPVIVAPRRDFRDPKVFKNTGTGLWNVVLAAGDEVQFWSSKNLREWTYESSFGKSYGSHAGVWECPDLFELDGKWVLIVNVGSGGPAGGSATQYFIGDFDGKAFVCDDAPETVRWMDYGKDHYATVTWSGAPDGRKVALAWMSNWQYANSVPTKQFRSADSAPRDLRLLVRGSERILVSSPSPEMEAIRGEGRAVKAAGRETRLFPKARGAYELVFTYTPPKKGAAVITLSNDLGEKVVLSHDASAGTFTMDRRESGNVSFNKNFLAESTAPVRASGKVRLRVLADNSSIEIFGEDFCMTNLVFPSEAYNKVSVEGTKADIIVYPLQAQGGMASHFPTGRW